jgi:hypothetical protein
VASGVSTKSEITKVHDYIRTETDFHIFVRGVDKYLGGGGDKYLGGCCCLLWPGPCGNTRKGQGKSLTKFVFWACMARSETIILVILQI